MTARAETIAIPAGRLRSLRERVGKTQATIAEEAEIALHTYAELERGRAGWTPATLARIAGALGTTFAELFGEERDLIDARSRRLADRIATLPEDSRAVVERLVDLLVTSRD